MQDPTKSLNLAAMNCFVDTPILIFFSEFMDDSYENNSFIGVPDIASTRFLGFAVCSMVF